MLSTSVERVKTSLESNCAQSVEVCESKFAGAYAGEFERARTNPHLAVQYILAVDSQPTPGTYTRVFMGSNKNLSSVGRKVCVLVHPARERVFIIH